VLTEKNDQTIIILAHRLLYGHAVNRSAFIQPFLKLCDPVRVNNPLETTIREDSLAEVSFP